MTSSRASRWLRSLFTIRTVRARLLLAAICVEAVMLTLMVVNGLRVLDHGMAGQARAQAAQLTPVLQAALVTPLAQRDYATVQAILDESRATRVLSYLAVIDGRGRVIAASGLPAGADLPEPDAALSLGPKADGVFRYDVSAPVEVGGQSFGRVQFGLDLAPMVLALRTQFSQSVAIAAVEIVLSVALLTAIGVWLTRHLTGFTRLSEAVARGDYSTVEVVEGTDDIGRLGIAFNAMTRAVRERVAELEVAIRRREEVEEDLRDSEARLRDMAEAASDWFWEAGPDYRLTFASERIAAVLGVKPNAVVGLDWFDLGLAEHPDRAEAHHEDVAARRAFRDLEFDVGPPGGKDYRTIRVSGAPVFDSAGVFHGYRGVGADVTREAEAERRAARARQQLVDALESLADAIAVYDADDRMVICNSAYRDLAGLDVAACEAGISFPDVLRTAHRYKLFTIEGDEFETWLADRVRRHRAPDGYVFVVRTGAGGWFQSREFATREGGVVSVRIDITELKRREMELDALRRRYGLILDSVAEGIVGLDRGGRVTFANPAAAALLGYEAAVMVGADLATLVGQGDGGRASEDGRSIPAAPRILAACRDAEGVEGRGETILDSSGHLLPIDYYLGPIVDEDCIGGSVLLLRDATLRLQYEWTLANQQEELARQVAERTAELKREVEVRARTEMALRASRERMRAITDSLVEGVLLTDRQGQLVFANPSARQLLRCGQVEEIEGYPLDEFMMILGPGGPVPFDRSPLGAMLERGSASIDNDAQFRLTGGETLAVAYACAPFVDDDIGRGAIVSFRDIGVLKLAQQETMQSARLASIGQLAAGIAHEINTPIQYIGDNLRYISESLVKLRAVADQGMAVARAVAEGGDAPAAAAQFQADIVRLRLPRLLGDLPDAVAESLDGVAQIARIVLSMKEFSHPGTTAKTATDINRALDSTLTVCRNSWKHVAQVERDFAPDLPPVVCHAGEINQVFLNLIMNAAQAIESSGKPLPGQIVVSTRLDGQMVTIRVADSGSGIPDGIRERIFDPFFTTKAVGKGTGQGLAICRDVVIVKHGGRIEVGNRPEGGAEFVVRLPLDGGGTLAEDAA